MTKLKPEETSTTRHIELSVCSPSAGKTLNRLRYLTSTTIRHYERFENAKQLSYLPALDRKWRGSALKPKSNGICRRKVCRAGNLSTLKDGQRESHRDVDLLGMVTSCIDNLWFLYPICKFTALARDVSNPDAMEKTQWNDVTSCAVHETKYRGCARYDLSCSSFVRCFPLILHLNCHCT
jgi:hypothetical protein